MDKKFYFDFAPSATVEIDIYLTKYFPVQPHFQYSVARFTSQYKTKFKYNKKVLVQLWFQSLSCKYSPSLPRISEGISHWSLSLPVENKLLKTKNDELRDVGLCNGRNIVRLTIYL